jgi:hypothetical protein
MKRIAQASRVRQVFAAVVATGGSTRDGGNPNLVSNQGDVGCGTKNSHVGRIGLPEGERDATDL